jgi:hypothetical protein
MRYPVAGTDNNWLTQTNVERDLLPDLVGATLVCISLISSLRSLVFY